MISGNHFRVILRDSYFETERRLEFWNYIIDVWMLTKAGEWPRERDRGREIERDREGEREGERERES
jgi:hypothetical protein